jgi:hypothetical protein
MTFMRPSGEGDSGEPRGAPLRGAPGFPGRRGENGRAA